MTREELIQQFDEEYPGETDWEIFQSWLIDYILRLRNGHWTKEEIHDLCHDLPSTVSLEEFKEGCRKQQEKLYGGWQFLCDAIPEKNRIVEVKRPTAKPNLRKAIFAHDAWRDWETFVAFHPALDMMWRYCDG